MGNFKGRKNFGGNGGGNYKKNNFSGGFGSGNNFRKPRFGAGGRSDSTEMFDAVCSNCGKDCQVPFRPTGNKPVLCKSCFQKERGQDEGNTFRSNNRDQRPPRYSTDRREGPSSYGPEFQKPAGSNQYKKDFEALNAKLDKILSLLNQQKPSKAEFTPLTVSVPDQELIEEIIAAPVVEKKAKSQAKASTKAAAKGKKASAPKKGPKPVKV